MAARKQDDAWEEADESSTIPLQIPGKYRRLIIEEQDLSVRDLWGRFLSGELVLEPDFQRHYVWDSQRAGRFIESVLLGLPLPRVFLAENNEGSVDVIDGHQRLETLFRFMTQAKSVSTTVSIVFCCDALYVTRRCNFLR